LVIIALTLTAAFVLAVLGVRSGAQGSSIARFDVIFDDARGLVGGQLVKIAGAKAGTIENVVVTPDFKARVEATIESRFMPFHRDATCTIRPEGLIAENYVDCDPGTPSSSPLPSVGGHPPTVPVANTTEPVSLLDLFNIFNMPTRQRFTAIVNELGIGTSGRGQDFNAILRRANPALALARQVISLLNRQRSQLGAIIDATGTIAAEGAGHTTAVQSFLDRAAALSSLTANHRGNLSQAVARLPGLLAAAQPSLEQLDTVARDGTPLVAQLHAAVPALNRAQSDLGPFVAAAAPALKRLGSSLREATPTIRDTTPLVRTVRSYAAASLPGTQLFARVASNLQRHGFVENFLGILYYISASLSRFDSTSHMLAILLVGAQNGLCGAYATTPVPGCSAHYGSAPAYTPAVAPSSRRVNRLRASHPRVAAAGGSTLPPGTAAGQPVSAPGQPSATAPPAGAAPGPQPAPSGSGGAVQQTVNNLQNLVSYLLK
jgi:phospholipid/cholesterol/gamma-HCH transport system substrate-binding protein